ncbi:MAG TPA: sugar transferase [Chloroflexota bacterium]|nr:sugar transferase [Chloroflexota bacterium]
MGSQPGRSKRSGGGASSGHTRLRRRGKEWRERFVATLLLGVSSPVIALCAGAIKLESILDPKARGPVFFREARVSRGRIIQMLKFRTLTSEALAGLGEGPTHIAELERAGQLTRAGRVIRQWYLDELPQLWNIVRGDMFLIGTRPYPVELYEEELSRGVTRKRDMPAGLVGPVQAHKGSPNHPDSLDLDAEYWYAFQHFSAFRLFLLDLRILLRSARVQLEHKGI